jgi:galactonate dehydratase
LTQHSLERRTTDDDFMRPSLHAVILLSRKDYVMRISRVETFMVPPRWLFLRIETDTGLVGWGEPGLEGFAEITRTAVEHMSEYLLGLDPLQIERHWQVLSKRGMYRGGPIFMSAVAGIDQALWDIAGKFAGMPVYQMIGGPVRDRVRMYGWVGGDEPSELADAISQQLDAGFTAVKMNASGRMRVSPNVDDIDGVAERLATAREILGPHRDVAVDFHGRFTTAGSIRALQVIEEFHPLFAEEPLLPEHVHRIRDVVQQTSIPIALGERLHSRHEFLLPLASGISVAQPDLSHAGGITEVRKIASLAETYDVHLAPHCPLGPIAIASCLTIGFSTQNHLIQEMSLGIHYNKGLELYEYLQDPSVLQIKDGYIEKFSKPGLGIDINEKAVRKADKDGHKWRSPLWFHDDGSFQEW